VVLKEGFWLDVTHFRRQLAVCQNHEHPPEEVCPVCLPLLAEAMALYTDDFLAGFTLRDSAEFDDWQFFQAESLRQELATGLECLVQALRAQGEYVSAIPHARRWVGLDPLYGPAQRMLIQLYDQAEQPSAAIRQYEEYVALLDEEFGLPPEEEIATLYEAIKAKRILGPFIKTGQKSSLVGTQARSAMHGTEPGKSSRPARISEELERYELLQEIRFCTAPDDTRIAYATVGQGPALVRAATYLTHLEYDWNSPVWRHWLEGLAKHHTLVRYDQRGCGLSDWDVEDFSLDAEVQDMETVVDALGLDHFPLLGISHSGPVVIAYAVRHPEKVSHLILYGSFARGFLKRDQTPAQLEEAEMYLKLIKVGWGRDNPVFRQVFSTLFLPEGTPEQINWFNDSSECQPRRQMLSNVTPPPTNLMSLS
jgi:hypothetical protein